MVTPYWQQPGVGGLLGVETVQSRCCAGESREREYKGHGCEGEKEKMKVHS